MRYFILVFIERRFDPLHLWNLWYFKWIFLHDLLNMPLESHMKIVKILFAETIEVFSDASDFLTDFGVELVLELIETHDLLGYFEEEHLQVIKTLRYPVVFIFEGYCEVKDAR